MRTVRIILIAAFFVGLSPAAHAEIPPEILRRLDAQELAAREEASDYIKQSRSISEMEIMALLEDSRHTLSPEQYDRLLHVLEDRFMDRPGVLGLRFDNSIENPFITVTWLEPTTPAARVLQVGDVLLQLNEVNLRPEPGTRSPTTRLSGRLQRCRAGDVVTLQIERDGEALEVKVELADPSRLGGVFESSFRLDRYQAGRAAIWQEEFIDRFEPSPPLMPLAVEEVAGDEGGSVSDQTLGRATRLQGRLRAELFNLRGEIEALRREADAANGAQHGLAVREQLADAMDRARRVGAYLEISEHELNSAWPNRPRRLP